MMTDSLKLTDGEIKVGDGFWTLDQDSDVTRRYLAFVAWTGPDFDQEWLAVCEQTQRGFPLRVCYATEEEANKAALQYATHRLETLDREREKYLKVVGEALADESVVLG